jgi:hypothetical protein
MQNVCKVVGSSENCENVEACDEIRCFCLSGHRRNKNGLCSDRKCSSLKRAISEARNSNSLECQKGFYGPNCALRGNPNCYKVDKHTGECSGGCVYNYKPPDCIKGLFV